MQGTSLMYTLIIQVRKNGTTPSISRLSATAAFITTVGWREQRSCIPMAPQRMNTVAADDGWELYDTTVDFSLSNDLAARIPSA